MSKDAELEVVRTQVPHPETLTSIAQDFNSFIAQPTQDIRVYSLPNYTETIPNRDALDGDYKLAIKEPDNLTPRGVDITSLRIYIQASDLSTTEVHREDWTLIQDKRVVDFNISQAEKSGAASQFQRKDNRTFYHLSLIHI